MEYNIQHACIIYITPAVPDAVVMPLQIWHFLHPSKVKFSKILIYICHMINHCEKKTFVIDVYYMSRGIYASTFI